MVFSLLRQCILSFLYFAFERVEEVRIEGKGQYPIGKGQLEGVLHARKGLAFLPFADRIGTFYTHDERHVLLAIAPDPPVTSQAVGYRLHIPLELMISVFSR